MKDSDCYKLLCFLYNPENHDEKWAFQRHMEVVLLFSSKAEKEGFIYPVDSECLQFPILATIDTVNACNLDCATCLKPGWQENGERMGVNLFKRILDKLCLMGIREVELYNYTEPFLNPNIYDFMAEVKHRNLTLGISTNLSLPNIPKLKECVDLLENGDWFVITISGISQDIYEINHRRGKIDNVIENIKNISKSLKRGIGRLRLLDFDYNKGEIPLAMKLAEEYGISFESFPAERSPFNFDTRKSWEEYIVKGITYNDYDRSSTPDGFYCPFIHSRNIVINHRGNVELCCRDVTRPYDLGSFLDQDISVIQMKRTLHPLCHSCIHQQEAPEEWAKLRKYFPVNVGMVSKMMRHAMYTITNERVLAARSFMPELKNDIEFIHLMIEKLSTR